jgi:hypothetical protein
MFGSGFKPNRRNRNNLCDVNIFCPRVCNSRVGDIFKINDLLAAFVVFTATIKVGVKRFYRSRYFLHLVQIETGGSISTTSSSESSTLEPIKDRMGSMWV